MVFLTPNLPPAICGVADHSMLLGRALRDLGHEVSLIGLRGEPEAARQSGWAGKVVLWNGSIQALVGVVGDMSPTWLWVQLSGYGYSRYGSPWKLGMALVRLKEKLRDLRIAICVHETHCEPQQLGAKGLVLSVLQKYAVRRVVRLGDVVFATIPAWERRCVIEYGMPRGRVHQLPIAASIPNVRLSAERRIELRLQLGIDAREQVAVAFGRWDSQRLALDRLGQAVKSALWAGDLDRVIAVGGESPRPPADIAQFFDHLLWANRLLVVGPQTPERVGELLSISDVGLVPTPLEFWPKSSAARAFERAGLTLWIVTEGKPRIVRPCGNPPTWEIIATSAANRLQACVR